MHYLNITWNFLKLRLTFFSTIVIKPSQLAIVCLSFAEYVVEVIAAIDIIYLVNLHHVVHTCVVRARTLSHEFFFWLSKLSYEYVLVTEVRLHCISHLKDHVTSIRDQRRLISLETVSSITPATAWLAQLRPFGNVRCSCVAFSVPGHNAALALHTLPRKSVFETPMGHQ